jgi:hypothetical protein
VNNAACSRFLRGAQGQPGGQLIVRSDVLTVAFNDTRAVLHDIRALGVKDFRRQSGDRQPGGQLRAVNHQPTVALPARQRVGKLRFLAAVIANLKPIRQALTKILLFIGGPSLFLCAIQ